MLLLFDIDGTLLIEAAGAHRDAIHEALRVVHGVTNPRRAGFEVAGRTDAEIARALLMNAGIPGATHADRSRGHSRPYAAQAATRTSSARASICSALTPAWTSSVREMSASVRPATSIPCRSGSVTPWTTRSAS